MYMGQITVGQEAVKYFLAGIELMKKTLASVTSQEVMSLMCLGSNAQHVQAAAENRTFHSLL